MTAPYATIREALLALPSGAEAIADHLQSMGVRAHCNQPSQCAIAEYLTQVLEVPLGHVVRVSNNAASFRHGKHGVKPLEMCWFGDVGGGTYIDRQDIREFIVNFDRGQYPALVAAELAAAA